MTGPGKIFDKTGREKYRESEDSSENVFEESLANLGYTEIEMIEMIEMIVTKSKDRGEVSDKLLRVYGGCFGAKKR